MTAGQILIIIAAILFVPVGVYLRAQTYRSVYGNSTIREDLRLLREKKRARREWRSIKREIKRRNSRENK